MRKGLTVRENVRLIEASPAQLFFVAARRCTERLGGWDPDVILHLGSTRAITILTNTSRTRRERERERRGDVKSVRARLGRAMTQLCFSLH